MTELPKSLRDAAIDQAKHEDSDGYFGFLSGVEWLYGHQLSQATEWDEKEATRAYNNIDMDKVMTSYGQSLKLAKWQHAQTSAIYQAKLAQKDETIADIRAVLKQSGEIQDQMKEEIERLKAKLGEADMKFEAVKQEAEKRRKSEEKLAARVVELKHAVDVALAFCPLEATWRHVLEKALRGEHASDT